jgi:hypothetical protein
VRGFGAIDQLEEGRKKKMEGKKGPNSLHGRRVSLLDPSSSVSCCLKTFMRRHFKTEKG